MKIKNNPYAPLGKKELYPGQVKDLGMENFFRLESKRDISVKELNDIRDFMDDNLLQPYSVQKNYSSKIFRDTGKSNAKGYVFYFSKLEDMVFFKLEYSDLVIS